MNHTTEPHHSERDTGRRSTLEDIEQGGKRAGLRVEEWSGKFAGAGINQSALGWPAACWVVVLLAALGGLIYLHYQPLPASPVWALLPIDNRAEIMWHIPGMLGALVLLMLLGLLWGIRRRARRRNYRHFRRTRQTGYTIGGLLEELQALSGEVVSAADDGSPIAQWRAGNAALIEEIDRVAREIFGMADAMDGIGETASKSTKRAHTSAEAANSGAAAIDDAIAGLSATRSRIQEAAEQLKQLGESSRRIDANVELLRDTTEQTNVLSLNTALQAAMVGEAGRGFAVAAEEVRRLAERAAHGAGEIAEQSHAIQSGADRIIASMQATDGEVAAGAALADEAGRALKEIQNAGRELLEMIALSAATVAGEVTVAQAVGDKMDKLKIASEQSDEKVSEAMRSIEKIIVMVDKLGDSLPGFKLPGR